MDIAADGSLEDGAGDFDDMADDCLGDESPAGSSPALGSPSSGTPNCGCGVSLEAPPWRLAAAAAAGAGAGICGGGGRRSWPCCSSPSAPSSVTRDIAADDSLEDGAGDSHDMAEDCLDDTSPAGSSSALGSLNSGSPNCGSNMFALVRASRACVPGVRPGRAAGRAAGRASCFVFSCMRVVCEYKIRSLIL